MGFPCDLAGKESTYNAGDLGLIPGLGRSPGEGKGYPLQYSGLENSMDYIAHGVTKSRTQLSNFHFQDIMKGLGDLCISPHWDIYQPFSDIAGKLRPVHWTMLSMLLWQPNTKVDLLVTTSQRKANSGVVLWNYKRIVCYKGQNYGLMASNWSRKQLTINSKREKLPLFLILKMLDRNYFMQTLHVPFHEPAISASSFPHHLILQFLDNHVLVNCRRIAGHRFHTHTRSRIRN